MTMMLDRRNEIEGPGLHALVVGISRYANLPAPGQLGRREQFNLTSVDGPAVSAWRIAQRLLSAQAGVQLIRPLKTLRIALAPTANDGLVEPALAGWAGTIPTYDALRALARDWRHDCEVSNDEASLFSFTGHGLYWEDALLVLADFGQDAGLGDVSLARCVKRDRLIAALSGPAPDGAMARRQFWFIDACSNIVGDDMPRQIEEPGVLLSPRFEDGQEQWIGGLASAAPATAAFVFPDGTGTPFAEALVKALDGAVTEAVPWPLEHPDAVEAWPVTIGSLQATIEGRLAQNPLTRNQHPRLLGYEHRTPLLLYDHPPPVDLWIRVLPPREPGSVQSIQVWEAFLPVAERKQYCPLDPHPFTFTTRAGSYQAEWTIEGRTKRKTWFASLANNELVL